MIQYNCQERENKRERKGKKMKKNKMTVDERIKKSWKRQCFLGNILYGFIFVITAIIGGGIYTFAFWALHTCLI